MNLAVCSSVLWVYSQSFSCCVIARSVIRSMVKQSGKKFTWVIKNIHSYETCVSDRYEIGTTGCTCHLLSFPRTNNPDLFQVHLLISCHQSAPTIGRRYVKFRITVVNQLSEELSVMEEGLHWFDSLTMQWGSATEFLIPRLRDKDGGFLVNDEMKISAEVEVLQVLDKLVTLEDFDNTTKPLSMDVNGFHVFPSQVESVMRLFERHPDIAVRFRAKNQLLSNSCMNSLLSLIDTLCQPLQDLSNEDLVEADIALTYVKDSGFRVDWLEKKLDQVKEKKEKEVSGLAILQETEEKLLELKRKCAELEALAEEKKVELADTRTPLSFDDVV